MSKQSLAFRVHNGADVLDSRDIIKRISELEGELQDEHTEARAQVQDDDDPADVPNADLEEWISEQADGGYDSASELKALRSLQADADGSPDWVHGETLIRDSYFETYAQELADDIGAIDANANWPCNYIDWERAADALKMDYFSVDFDGVEYWIRS